MYHYFYRITNGINGKIYYGIHSTDNLNDGYMGSGSLILKAIKKYGKENFTKDIIKFFDSRDELSKFEKEFVNIELVNDPNCYNLITGGLEPQGYIEFLRSHLLVCDPNDPNHKVFSISRDDPRLKTGELVQAAKILYKGKITVRDGNGNCFMVSKDDPRYLSGELIPNTKGKCLGMVTCKDKDGNTYKVNKDDPRLKTGELVGITKGLVPVKDNMGKTMLVSKDDPRYISGNLKHNTSGFTTVKDNHGNYIQVSKDDPRLKTGEFVGITKGMVVVKDNTGKNILISKDDPRYISGELVSNRIGLKWINRDGKLKSVPPEDLQSYLTDGWKLGVGDARKKPHRKNKSIQHRQSTEAGGGESEAL